MIVNTKFNVLLFLVALSFGMAGLIQPKEVSAQGFEVTNNIV